MSATRANGITPTKAWRSPIVLQLAVAVSLVSPRGAESQKPGGL
jgi:hypothetical protein